LEAAFNKTAQILFKPFNLRKWLIIAFTAWLATLLSNTGGCSFKYSNRMPSRSCRYVQEQSCNPPGSATQIPDLALLDNIPFFRRVPDLSFEHFFDFSFTPLVILPLAILVIPLLILAVWLSSRGRFMFTHCIANNTGQVKVPWKEYRREANSLFFFRLVIAAANLIPVGLISVGVAVLSFGLAGHHNFQFANVPLLLAFILLLAVSITAMLVLLLVSFFTNTLVLPIMFTQRLSTINAWRKLMAVMKTQTLGFVILPLVYVLIDIGLGLVVMAVLFLTCCCCLPLLVLPYINVVILLPLLMFKRTYGLSFIAQMGPEYDVFYNRFGTSEPQTAPTPAPSSTQ